MKRFHHKSIDLIVLTIFLIVAPIISLYFQTSLLVSLLFFYGLPAIWLSFRGRKHIQKAAFFSLIATFVFYIVDFIAVKDGGWWVSTIFSIRLPGGLPIEDTLWLFLGVYTVIMFYKHFDDRDTRTKTHIRYLELVVAIMFLCFVIVAAYFPQWLIIPYAYFLIGLLFAIVPAIIILWLHPPLRLKFLRTQLYIFCLHLTFELTALSLGQWGFPGKHFIGWVQVINFRFPLEEFVVWISMTAIAVLSYYEFYYDDRK